MAPIVISEEAKRAANLRVLQRSDADIVDIIGSATHVVLYEFNAASKAWEKRNVEGSLFVAKRSSSPRFKMIVMNRNSKDNLEVPLSSTFQMQVREPYLIFRSEKSETKIKGIWFHDGKERQSIVEILNRAVKSLSAKDNSTVQQNNDARQPQMNKEQAAASLMSALKIGGSSSDTGSTAQQKQVSAPSTPQQPNTQDTNVQNMVLDKKSLQLSLMSLLQEDKFLDLIHTQYLKVAKARSSGNIKK